MKKIRNLLAITLAVFSLISCEVGLGEAVDTKAPTIDVTSPEPTQSVQGEVYISGVAKDNLELKEVFIDVEHRDNEVAPRNFKISNFELFEKVDDNWIPYLDGNIIGDKKTITWDLNVTLNNASPGSDYEITVLVTDMFGNESKKSKETRVITVDYNSPIVTVSSPSLIKKYDTAVALTDSYKLKNNAILNQLINGTFIISGSQEEDTQCDHLIIYLDALTTEDISMYKDSDAARNFNLRSGPTSYLAYKRIDDKNQRNWEVNFDVNEFPAEYKTGKHLIRVVTESHDSADNTEIKVQGWFTLWNEADIPWVSAEFGGSSFETQASVYPSCELYGQAFDDDGLSELSIDLYKRNDNQWIKMEDKGLSVDLASKDYPTYYSWSINSLSDNCSFYIVAKCKDKNGKESETVTRYMSVMDTNPPSIYVDQTTFGDSIPLTGNGDFTFKGKISDDGEIKSLKVVRIADGKETSEIKYFDSKYSEWSKATASGYTDVNGNKIWTIPMDAEVVENKLHSRDFNHTFNIYRDFGINGSSELLSTQKLIVYAQDNGGSAGIEMVAFGGDTEKPVVTIDKITINGTLEKSLNETQILEPFKPTDYVVLSGTWKDNTDVLTKDSLELTWEKVNDFGITFTYDDASKTSGKWTTKRITPPTSTTAVIYAELRDWGSNLGKTNASFYVSSSLPEFVRISADTSDGSYGDGSEILIYMEFNKKVTFKGGTPSLTLNTGRTAVYKEGNGTSKHIFTYTVMQGDNTDQLKVSALNSTGIKWHDVEVDTTTIANMSLPTGTNTLEANRNIIIDTTSPTIKAVSAITSPGYYGENAEIFITAKFSEIVNFENIDDLKLILNSGNNVKTSSVSKSGPDTVLFKYKVEKGHEAAPLNISNISFGNCNVYDIAGNKLMDKDKAITTVRTSINIDTTAPNTPIISGTTDGAVIYQEEGVKISIDYKEATGIKKYSLDGGKSWNDYTGEFTLLNKGTYNITAYQEDVAGNQSDEASPVTVVVDRGPIITSLTANKPDGTYKTGQKISIIVNFRKEVNVSDNSYLVLNTTPARNAKYVSGSGSKKLYFEYEISEGDSCSEQPLEPQSFAGTITDVSGNDIAAYTALRFVTAPNRFIDNKEIYVITKAPEVTRVEFGGTNESNRVLNVSFTSNANKKTGTIKIVQSSTGYKVPVVLTETQYNKYSNSIKSYYEVGTNGANASGVSDLSTKYVLKYNYSSDLKELVDLFIAEKALEVNIPLYSKAVTIEKNVLTVDLSDTYKLPVKGAEYSVVIPAGLINDDIGQASKAYESKINLPGVEKPYFRINKTNEQIVNGVAQQPFTATVKIDCQTPNSEIYYVNGEKTYAQKRLTQKSDYDQGYANKGMPATPATPTASSSKYTAPFSLGSANTTTYTTGYKVFLRARGKLGTAWSEDSYETAYRTVIVFDQDPGSGKTMWIRGGNTPKGQVSVSNFPFNWETKDYDKVRAMTKKSGNLWYWISWNLNTTTYIGFLSGDMPNDAAINGPKNWIWGSCSWVSLREKYPIYPGESFYFVNLNEWESGNYVFQGKHQESR